MPSRLHSGETAVIIGNRNRLIWRSPFPVYDRRRFDMKTVVKAGIAAACGTLIGAVGMVQSTGAQQQPPATTTTPKTTQPPAASTTPPTTPMQPGPGMGRQMMQGQGMGRRMMQQGTGSEGTGQNSGQQMMHMGQQMRTMGQQMMSGRANVQEQELVGRQMMDMGPQMQNMGQQMVNEHGATQTAPEATTPATPK
jgi:hypothetical protein